MDGAPSDRTERFLSLCRKAQIDAELASDIHSVLWNKFAFICALAGMTATVRLPLGAILENEASLEMAKEIMREIVTIAAAEGVTLPSETVDKGIGLAKKMDPRHFLFPSLRHDAGKAHGVGGAPRHSHPPGSQARSRGSQV